MADVSGAQQLCWLTSCCKFASVWPWWQMRPLFYFILSTHRPLIVPKQIVRHNAGLDVLDGHRVLHIRRRSLHLSGCFRPRSLFHLPAVPLLVPRTLLCSAAHFRLVLHRVSIESSSMQCKVPFVSHARPSPRHSSQPPSIGGFSS